LIKRLAAISRGCGINLRRLSPNGLLRLEHDAQFAPRIQGM
jgi:hypothetical protein